MQNQERILKGLGHKGLKEMFETIADDRRSDRFVMIAMLLILASFAILGGQAMKILFRTNFGKNKIKKSTVILTSLPFFGWAYLCFDLIIQNKEYSNETPLVLLASIFYIFLGVFILVIGFAEADSAIYRKIDENYKGDSLLLRFLINSNWRQFYIQHIAEPVTIFTIGTSATIIHPFFGLPLIACSLALVAYNFYFGIEPDSYDTPVIIEKSNDKKGGFSSVTY